GQIGCDGSGYSIYRSTNGGLTWTEHVLPTSESGTADTWNAEEAQVAIDMDNNVHAMWMGADDMPYYAYSLDEGDSWSDAMMIAPPIGLQGTGFPVVTAGDSGRVAFGYVGDTGNDTWNGYLTIMTDAFSDAPLMTTVQINQPGDPLDTEAGCGYNRCGGLGDFLDMSVDQYGRPWFGLSHNLQDIGIFATTIEGPTLRGNVAELTVMPTGGPETL
ncbi:MAG: sialidase family protein, partial [Candidatus Thalassarchaeaceae archaeon]|nr:sialidase family protein [Candidatus Thalassarchaeaceae archaeon]